MKKLIRHRLLVTRQDLLERFDYIYPPIPENVSIWLRTGEERIPAAPMDENDILEFEWEIEDETE